MFPDKVTVRVKFDNIYIGIPQFTERAGLSNCYIVTICCTGNSIGNIFSFTSKCFFPNDLSVAIHFYCQNIISSLSIRTALPDHNHRAVFRRSYTIGDIFARPSKSDLPAAGKLAFFGDSLLLGRCLFCCCSQKRCGTKTGGSRSKKNIFDYFCHERSL